MYNETIKREKEEIIKKYGPWTAHNIQLTDDIYTIDKRVVGDEIKLKRIIQIISDIIAKPFENLRILDLACLEGLYAIELARQGSKAVGIEGREANIEKARFTKNVLGLDNLELIQDDVRNLNKEKHGSFDVVLCLGILYHLDAPDVFCFLEKIAEVCQGIAIIDTHISFCARKSHSYKDKKYWGKNYREHYRFSNQARKEKALWASLDNITSFWFTRCSLYNILSDYGFTSVFECHNPPDPKKSKDRITLLAIKGKEKKIITTPLINEAPQVFWPGK